MALLDFPLWNFALNFVMDFVMLQFWVLLVHLYIIPIIQKKKHGLFDMYMWFEYCIFVERD